jgi:hypothetical protein
MAVGAESGAPLEHMMRPLGQQAALGRLMLKVGTPERNGERIPTEVCCDPLPRHSQSMDVISINPADAMRKKLRLSPTDAMSNANSCCLHPSRCGHGVAERAPQVRGESSDGRGKDPEIGLLRKAVDRRHAREYALTGSNPCASMRAAEVRNQREVRLGSWPDGHYCVAAFRAGSTSWLRSLTMRSTVSVGGRRAG